MTDYILDWMHEDELKPSDEMPRWLIKTARSSHDLLLPKTTGDNFAHA